MKVTRSLLKLLLKVWYKIGCVTIGMWRRWQDSRTTTYIAPVSAANLHLYFRSISTNQLAPYSRQIADLSKLAIAHYFDLLGSGWVEVKYGMHCKGVEGNRYNMGLSIYPDRDGAWLESRVNASNVRESRRIWRLIDPDYEPIDWHLDFKSGFRWFESTWYKDIKFGHVPGVDVKVPWELARAQHLPMLGWAYKFASEGNPGFLQSEAYAREFRNQILDFIATNPPRFGVNWFTSMDVAVRAVNWLVAYDLFRACGVEFDTDFEAEFQRSLIQHGEHIITNLEWAPKLRSNHYLANIAGLLFIAAYLPISPRVNTWLAFALQELAYEILTQFNPDGTNFEASTSYHRLSAEMVIYAVALGLAMPPDKTTSIRTHSRDLYRLPRSLPGDSNKLPLPWTEEHLERILKMAEFTMHITKPSGQIPQFGDNDSGRFLKLIPDINPISITDACALYSNLENYDAAVEMKTYWDEQVLDHRHLVAAINGLFDQPALAEFANTPETTILRSLLGNSFSPPRIQRTTSGAEGLQVGVNWLSMVEMVRAQPKVICQVISASAEGSLREGIYTCAYPDFGLYLFRSSRLYLAIRCGAVGQSGNGGHAHNDQLSIELAIDGVDRIVDPGTYVYTPLPKRRQEYRSVKAHYAPQPAHGEPGNLHKGLFTLGNEAQARCLYFGTEGFVGMHGGYGSPVHRLITVEDNAIIIEDAAEGIELCPLPESLWPPAEGIAISPKYGARRR